MQRPGCGSNQIAAKQSPKPTLERTAAIRRRYGSSAYLTVIKENINHLAVCTECTYIFIMEYEWDPGKAAENLRKHNMDFADAIIALEGVES